MNNSKITANQNPSCFKNAQVFKAAEIEQSFVVDTDINYQSRYDYNYHSCEF